MAEHHRTTNAKADPIKYELRLGFARHYCNQVFGVRWVGAEMLNGEVANIIPKSATWWTTSHPYLLPRCKEFKANTSNVI